MLASAGSSVKFWDPLNSKLIHEVSISFTQVRSMSWNKDGYLLASLDGRSSQISLNTVNSKSSICSAVFNVMDKVSCIQFGNQTNRFMAVGGKSDSLVIWDINNSSKRKSFQISKGRISKMSFNKMDTHLVAGTEVGTAFVCSNETNTVGSPIKLFFDKSKVTDICYSSTERSVFGSCGESGSIVLVDANVSKTLKSFKDVHSAPPSSLAFSPLNKLLMITVGFDKKLVTYDANSKSVLLSREMPFPLSSISFLHDNLIVAVGTTTGHILTYDLRYLNDPVSKIKAYKEGPVWDLGMQPKGTQNEVFPNKKIVNEKKNKNVTEPSVVSPPANGKCKVSSPLASTSVESVLSPTVDILSPIQSTNIKDVDNSLNFDKGNFVSPSQSSVASEFDDFGILSPINKENRSLICKEPSVSPKGKSGRFSFSDGILSPLAVDNSINSSAHSGISGSFDTENKILSNSKSRPKETSLLSNDSFPCGDLIADPYKMIKRQMRRSVESAAVAEAATQKKIVTLEPEKLTMSAEALGRVNSSLQYKSTDNLTSEKQEEQAHIGTHSEITETITKTTIGHESSEKIQASNIQSENVHSKSLSSGNNSSQINPNMNCVSSTAILNFISTEALSIGNSLSRRTPLDYSNGGVHDLSPHELAFPLSSNDLTCIPDKPNMERDISSSSNNINMELLKNHVDFALFQAENRLNERVMNLHFHLLKQFFGLKRDLLDSIKEHSLNDALVEENERLREEINRLKCIY